MIGLQRSRRVSACPDTIPLPAPASDRGMTFAPLACSGQAVQHAISVDLEDWQQSVFDRRLDLSPRLTRVTQRLLDLLARHRTKATFFVLGIVAERVPALVDLIHRQGHEVQSHGYDHTPLHLMTPADFVDDIRRAKGVVEDVISAPVNGYRAPRFSVDGDTLWALDVLCEQGFRYDSSIFPMRVRGYGIDGWPARIGTLTTAAGGRLIEAPVATWSIGRWRVPIGGGGYLRLLPAGVVERALRAAEDRGVAGVLYCHPHEFDPEAFRESPLRVPWTVRLHQGIGREGYPGKMDHLLSRFRFGPIRDLLP